LYRGDRLLNFRYFPGFDQHRNLMLSS